jgi:hypothetical protein
MASNSPGHGHAKSILALLVVMLVVTACVGRPAEVHGEHASFLPHVGNQVAAAPTNVGGRSDTSGLGAGMLISPGSEPTVTPTPGK